MSICFYIITLNFPCETISDQVLIYVKIFSLVCSVRSIHPEVFFEKDVQKICSKFTGENPCRGVISTKLLCNFIEITLRHECPPVNLLHIFRTPFIKNTSGRLLLFSVHNIISLSNREQVCLMRLRFERYFSHNLPLPDDGRSISRT